MAVPALLSRCGGARSSRSHLKCQETSQEAPKTFSTNAAIQLR